MAIPEAAALLPDLRILCVSIKPKPFSPGNGHSYVIGQRHDGEQRQGELCQRTGVEVMIIHVAQNQSDNNQRKQI